MLTDWQVTWWMGRWMDGLADKWMNESLSEIVTIIDLEKGKWKVTVERALEKKKYLWRPLWDKMKVRGTSLLFIFGNCELKFVNRVDILDRKGYITTAHLSSSKIVPFFGMFKSWSLVGVINMHELLGEESITCESHFKQTYQLTPDFKSFRSVKWKWF